ncbi:MAG: trypsin-like peptidase domain-containing protein [Nitrospira sp.]|nr:trypsin-like peptidase domain-containing protein [Nitrospira sp.]
MHNSVINSALFWLASLLFTVWVPVAVAEEQDPLEMLAAAVAFIQTPKIQTMQVDGKSYELYLKGPGDKEPKPRILMDTGTAFFVVDSEALFLVTANHVARAMSQESIVTIKTAKDKPLSFPISDLTGDGESSTWVSHDQADIAALRLKPKKSLFTHLQQHFLPLALFQEELASPLRSRALTTLGFPLGLGIGERFSPLSRESHPASGLLTLSVLAKDDPGTYFLLDSPSIGGFSGSPVCALPGAYTRGASLVLGGGLHCVGLVHGTVSDVTGGKMAAVVPSAFIFQVLRKAK